MKAIITGEKETRAEMAEEIKFSYIENLRN